MPTSAQYGLAPAVPDGTFIQPVPLVSSTATLSPLTVTGKGRPQQFAVRDDFVAWTKSQNFRDSHKNAGTGKVLTAGHPRFEGFSVIEGA